MDYLASCVNGALWIFPSHQIRPFLSINSLSWRTRVECQLLECWDVRLDFHLSKPDAGCSLSTVFWQSLFCSCKLSTLTVVACPDI